MKNLKKIAAVLLVILMVISVAGCSKVPASTKKEWSYKTDSKEYSIGVYIYSLYSAYNKAYSVLQEAQGDSFDENASILDVKSTFDETDEEFVCRDWVKKEADKITKNLIAIDNAIAEYGIEVGQATIDQAREQARSDWYLGQYYEYYASSGYLATSYESVIKPFGVSFNSFFESSYLASAKQTALFNYIYDKGGIKEVPDSEITDYFEGNYTSYSYFSVNLYESTTDETSGEQKSVALSDAKIAEIDKTLSSYVNDIKGGKSYSDVSAAYMKYASLSTDPTVSNIEDLEKSSLGEEVKAALNKLADNTATTVKVGEGESAIEYFVFKLPIKAETKEYTSIATNRSSLLQNLKNEEFMDYLDELTEKVECEINTAVVDLYNPDLFYEEPTGTTAAAA